MRHLDDIPRSPSGPRPGRADDVPLHRVLGAGEDPISLTIPLGTWRGVRVGAWAVLPIWMLAELIATLAQDRIGLTRMAMGMGAFFAVVLMREAARLVFGGWREGKHIVLWPLGGLTQATFYSPLPSIVRECGGLVAGMLAWPLLAWGLWRAGAGWGAIVFNPLAPGAPLSAMTSTWMIGLWWLYYANAVVLAVNLLTPAMPFDAGRIVRAAAARWLTREEAATLALRVGLIAALCLVVGAASGGQTRLMLAGIIALGLTWHQWRREIFSRGADWSPPPEHLLAPLPASTDAGSGQPTSAAPEAWSVPDGPAPLDIDEVLAKITRSGMSSLTPGEVQALRRATQRRRGDC